MLDRYACKVITKVIEDVDERTRPASITIVAEAGIAGDAACYSNSNTNARSKQYYHAKVSNDARSTYS